MLLNGVALGAGQHTRNDAIIQAKSLRVQFLVENMLRHHSTSGEIAINMLRYDIILDRTPGATLPNWDTIFKNIDTAGGASTHLLSSVNPDETQRFKVLRSKKVIMENGLENTKGLVDEWKNGFFYEEFIPLKDMEVKFKTTAAGGTVADMEKNAIYISRS